MSEKILIKKYPNRKLYADGVYISNNHILDFILRDIPFDVVLTKPQQDFTKQQILSTYVSLLKTGVQNLSKEELIERLKKDVPTLLGPREDLQSYFGSLKTDSLVLKTVDATV